MRDLGAEDHIDARVQSYYGVEFDQGDRRVGRSGAGILEFERTQAMIRDVVAPGSRPQVFGYLSDDEDRWLPETQRDATAMSLRAALARGS